MKFTFLFLSLAFGMLMSLVYAWLYSKFPLGLGRGGYVVVEPFSIHHWLSMAFPILMWLVGLVLGFCLRDKPPSAEAGHWLVRRLRALPLHFVVSVLAVVVVFAVANRVDAFFVSLGMFPGFIYSTMGNRIGKA